MTTQTEQVKEIIPEGTFINRMEALFNEINLLTEDIKVIKTEAKDQGYKPSKLAKIAKLRADAKVSSFVEDSKEILQYIEQNSL